MRTKFGFGDATKEGEESNPVELVAIPPFDQVYDLTKKESTALVAQKICAIATDKSYTPTEAHPIAAELKNNPKFREKIEQDALTKSGVSSESFVEKLGLKPTKTSEKQILPSHADIVREREEQRAHDAADPNREKSY